MTPLVQDLWDLEQRQAEWQVNEFQANDHGLARLQRFLHEVLACFDIRIPGIAHSYVAIAGLECGWFQPCASLRRQLETISATPTNGHQSSVAPHLSRESPIPCISDPRSDPHYRGEPDITERCILKLTSNDECFGFIVLDSRTQGTFEQFSEQLRKAQRVLSRIVAAAVFSMRLRLLGAPIQVPFGPPTELNVQGIALELASRTAYGFGADGAVLRLYNPATNMLEVVGKEGDVPSELLVSLGVGEGVAGRIFAAPGNAWYLADSGTPHDEQLRGIDIPSSEHERLPSVGINSYVVMKLSHYTSLGELSGLGTLSFMHKRAHRFSWQEVSLFQTYCQSAADSISLLRKNIALEETAENLRIQNLMLTRVEVVGLLAHDLGHRTMAAAVAIEDYVSACKKTLNKSTEVRSHTHLDERADSAIRATQEIGSALNQFRQLYRNEKELTGRITEFDVAEVVRYVESTLEGALYRRKISFKYQQTGNLKLRGHREILIQVLFNLTINSIEAIGNKSRPTSIHIHAHEERQGTLRRLIVQFWDDGPGINQRLFSPPEEIFNVGRTSKANGTGTGLPVVRRLLSQYFDGDILLAEPENARFKIVLPDRHPAKQ
jgi:signal transduction histidine kinase